MWLNVVEARMTRRLRTLVRMRSGDSGHRPVSTSDQYQPHLTNNKWQYFTKTSEQETFQSFFFSMGWSSSGKSFFLILWSVPFSAIKRIICMVQPCHSEEWSEKRKPFLVVNRGLEKWWSKNFFGEKSCDSVTVRSKLKCENMWWTFTPLSTILFSKVSKNWTNIVCWHLLTSFLRAEVVCNNPLILNNNNLQNNLMSPSQPYKLSCNNFPDLQSMKSIFYIV